MAGDVDALTPEAEVHRHDRYRAPPVSSPLSKSVVTVPALFFAAAESDYVRREAHPRIRDLFPRAHLRDVPDSGHWVHADQPEALVHGLHEWLSEASAVAAS